MPDGEPTVRLQEYQLHSTNSLTTKHTDILALTLDHLPPRYVSAIRGEAYAKAESFNPQSELIMGVTSHGGTGSSNMLTSQTEPDTERFMAVALELARDAAALGEVPIGAVVVKDGEVVAKAHNWRETWRDPTAHAELIAIQEASRRLGGWRLQACDLYVTLEPCPMCAGAVMLARMNHLYFGATDEKGGGIVSKIQVLQPGLWNHQPIITGGVMEDECGMILKDFFRHLRSHPNTRRDV